MRIINAGNHTGLKHQSSRYHNDNDNHTGLLPWCLTLMLKYTGLMIPWCFLRITKRDNRLDAWCKPPIRTCVCGWNLSTWIQPWSILINTSIAGILKPQLLYPIVQQERKWLFQRLDGVLLYSMGGLARPRVNLWHRLGSQPPPALRVARDTACHSARSIPPPVYIMCVRIYTGCEYLLSANIY